MSQLVTFENRQCDMLQKLVLSDGGTACFALAHARNALVELVDSY